MKIITLIDPGPIPTERASSPYFLIATNLTNSKIATTSARSQRVSSG